MPHDIKLPAAERQLRLTEALDRHRFVSVTEAAALLSVSGMTVRRDLKVLEQLGLRDQIPVCALAKQFEEVYLPERPEPVRIPRQSDALYLLQRLRDESHRFAITYQRQLRNKRMTVSWLDDIAGLGPTRRKRLVQELGSARAVRTASLESLRALTWLPEAVAEAVYEKGNRP